MENIWCKIEIYCQYMIFLFWISLYEWLSVCEIRCSVVLILIKWSSDFERLYIYMCRSIIRHVVFLIWCLFLALSSRCCFIFSYLFPLKVLQYSVCCESILTWCLLKPCLHSIHTCDVMFDLMLCCDDQVMIMQCLCGWENRSVAVQSI